MRRPLALVLDFLNPTEIDTDQKLIIIDEVFKETRIKEEVGEIYSNHLQYLLVDKKKVKKNLSSGYRFASLGEFCLYFSKRGWPADHILGPLDLATINISKKIIYVAHNKCRSSFIGSFVFGDRNFRLYNIRKYVLVKETP